MASDKDFWRKRRTKRVSRTELISYRIFPESRQKMERIALAENISLVEVIEKGIDLYDQLLSGKKADK